MEGLLKYLSKLPLLKSSAHEFHMPGDPFGTWISTAPVLSCLEGTNLCDQVRDFSTAGIDFHFQLTFSSSMHPWALTSFTRPIKDFCMGVLFMSHGAQMDNYTFFLFFFPCLNSLSLCFKNCSYCYYFTLLILVRGKCD